MIAILWFLSHLSYRLLLKIDKLIKVDTLCDDRN